jgi:hypothetical protein
MAPEFPPAVRVNVPTVSGLLIVTEPLTLEPDRPAPASTNGMVTSETGAEAKVTVMADVVSPAYMLDG